MKFEAFKFCLCTQILEQGLAAIRYSQAYFTEKIAHWWHYLEKKPLRAAFIFKKFWLSVEEYYQLKI